MAGKRDNYTLRISPEIRARLESVAARDDRSIAYVVNQCLEGYLPVLEAGARGHHLALNEPPAKRSRK